MSRNWAPAKSALDSGIHGLTLDDVSENSKPVAANLDQSLNDVVPLVTPIYHSATYRMTSVDQFTENANKGGYFYSRVNNPTCEAAEAAINALEGGAGSLVLSSGMAAITTALSAFLQAGDHIVACNPLYSGTHGYMTKILSKFKVDVTWVPTGESMEEYRKNIKANTKVLYGETPCNPKISILDLEEFGKLGQSENILTMVDSTCGSPFLQKPIKCGIDLVIHSATKYLGGHSDIIAGVITTRTHEQWTKLRSYRSSIGTVLSPFEASLLLRGIKTLHIRMERHSANAQRLAEYLEKHPKVQTVHYPGLHTHPGHAIAKKQMKGFSGMIAFEMKGGLEQAKKVVQSVKLIQFAVSLGGVESLIEHPASMTHGPLFMSDEERAEGWITDGLIRFSVGLEDAADLEKDLEQALAKA